MAAKNSAVGKKEFIYHGGLNELKPKKALSKELFYKFNVSGCEKTVEGILIQEYTNCDYVCH